MQTSTSTASSADAVSCEPTPSGMSTQPAKANAQEAHATTGPQPEKPVGPSSKRRRHRQRNHGGGDEERDRRHSGDSSPKSTSWDLDEAPEPQGKWVTTSAAAVTLLAVLAGAWLFGYVEPWSQVLASCALMLAAGLLLFANRFHLQQRTPAALWPLLLVLTVGILQTVPLPPEMLSVVSPEAVKLRRELYPLPDTDAWQPVSLLPAETQRSVALGLACVLAFVLGAALLSDGQSVRRLVWLVTISAVAMSYTGLLSSAWGNGVYGVIDAPGAAFGGFGNSNNAAGFLCMGLSAALAAASLTLRSHRTRTMIDRLPVASGHRTATRSDSFHDWFDRVWQNVLRFVSQTDVWRILAVIAVPTIVAAILFTGSRGGTIAMTIAVLTYVAVILPGGMTCRLVTGLLVLCLIAAPTVLLLTEMKRVETATAKLDSLARPEILAEDGRLPHWRDSLTAATHFPLLGAGMGTYSRVYPVYERLPLNGRFFHAENLFVEAALETGIIGLILIGAFLVCVAISVRRLLRTRRFGDRVVAAFCASVLLGQLTANSFDFGLFLFGNALLFCLILGTTAGASVRAAQIRLDNTGAGNEPAADGLPSPFAHGHLLKVMGALCVLAVPAFVDLSRAAAFQPMSRDTILVGVSGRRQIDEAFLHRRLRYAVANRPHDPTGHEMLAESYLRQFQLATNGGSDSGQPTVDDILHRLHRQAMQLRQRGEPTVLNDARESEYARRFLLPALHHLRRAAEECGLSAQLHRRIAHLSFLDTDPTREIVHLQCYLRIREGYRQTLFERGKAALQEGKRDEAIATWRECLTLGTVHRNQILQTSLQELSDDEFAEQLLPRSSFIVQQAAAFCANRPNAASLSNRLRLMTVSLKDQEALNGKNQ